jgi:hypothetical protein
MEEKSMPKERPAEVLDLFGRASKQLFARHRTTGQRISARRFYGLRDDGNDYEREGYVLMTTRAAYKPATDAVIRKATVKHGTAVRDGSAALG